MTVAIAVTAAAIVTGNQDITTADLNGETPKAVLFMYSRVAADGTISTADFGIQLGMATASVQATCVTMGRSGIINTGVPHARYSSQTSCIAALKWNGAAFVRHSEAAFVSFIPDGVRVNWTTADASDAWLITATFFSGSEWQAAITLHTIPNNYGSGPDTTVTAGFQPDGLIMMGTGDLMNNTISTFGNRFVLGFGFASWFGGTRETVASNYWSWTGGRQLVHSNASSVGLAGVCAGHWEVFSAQTGNLVTGRTATGFTAHASNIGTTDVYATLVLKFTGDGALRCGSFRISSTASGNQVYTATSNVGSTFGGQVKQFMLINGKETIDYVSQFEWRDSFGAMTADGKIGGFAFSGNSDGATMNASHPSQYSNTHFTDKFRMLDRETPPGLGVGTENARCTLTSFNIDGLTLNWSDPPNFSSFNGTTTAWDWFYFGIVDSTPLAQLEFDITEDPDLGSILLGAANRLTLEVTEDSDTVGTEDSPGFILNNMFFDDGEVFYLRWEDQSDEIAFEERTYTVNAEETIYRLPEDGPDHDTPYSKAQPRRRRIV